MEAVWRTLRRNTYPLFQLQRRGIYNDLDRYKRAVNNSVAAHKIDPPEFAKAKKTFQFSNRELDNYGMLSKGDIPEPLKFTRKFEMTTLNNGIRVCTESWPAGAATVAVAIGAGSRHETPETSGSAHFMEHLNFKVSLSYQ